MRHIVGNQHTSPTARRRVSEYVRVLMAAILLMPVSSIAFAMEADSPLPSPALTQAQRQSPQDTVRRDTTVFSVDPIVVTATRTARPVFQIPAPASVIDRNALSRSKPNTITDMFRDMAGLDVNGVGVQQPRPVIRGQRGQRILLLSDGLRLNSSRRQQDFGEIPSLIDPSQIERVEVVRGPASVLYGTDAIGGVVNMLTRQPTEDGVHGEFGYLYGAEEEQHRGTASLFARSGAWDLQASGAWREAGAYRAPAGEFGAIVLDDATMVNATGIRDWNGSFRLGRELAAGHSLFARVEHYESENAGFGYIEPDAYAPEQPRIEIRYPEQKYTRASLGWSGRQLDLAFADRIDLTTYWQDNERSLTFDLFQGFGPRAPPGAGVQIDTHNFSDIGTVGLRLETKKLATSSLLFTYGLDFFRDNSANTDSSVTTVVGFGPPQTELSTREQVPNATYRSIGGFAQGELTAGQLTLILGTRFQDILANAEEGQGVPAGLTSKSARTLVGSANVLYAVTPNLALVGSVGRAFRAPNLIEWFFDGPTPEGNGYQVRSPDLEPETSVNFDVGIRYRDSRIAVEAFAYRNSVRDGIRIQPRNDTIQGFPAFQNVNLDKLLFRGIEVSTELIVGAGVSVAGTYTSSDSEDELDPNTPIGDTFSSKLTAALRYRDGDGRFWAEYGMRHNGERKDVILGTNPLGDLLPSFTTHAVRGGVRLPQWNRTTTRLGIAVENLTNELYSEFTNASFFRPEPRRRVTLSIDVGF